MDHEITVATGDPPIPTPRKRSRVKGVTKGLAQIANTQVQAEIQNARAIVMPAAETIAEIYGALPEILHGEAMSLLDQRMPMIEQANDALMADCRSAGRSAVAASRTIADEFLAQYGIGAIDE